jgi:hypothetical protein
MWTIDQIQTGIDNAKAAGDDAAVARLTQLLAEAKQQGAAESAPLTAEQVVGGAIKKAPSSAWRLANDYYHAIRHPLQTADSMLDLAAGGISNGITAGLGFRPSFMPENKATATADAVGQFYKDRYGGWENIKKTIATDPVGLAADLSVPLTLGGDALARAPGVMGRVGELAATTGRMVDPVTHLPQAARVVARRAANYTGVRSGAGSPAIYDTFNAARRGGVGADALDANLKGTVPIEDVVPVAKRGLEAIKQDRANAYRASIAGTKASTTKIPFQPIVDAYNNMIDGMHQAGMWTGGAQSTAMANRVANLIQTWAQSPSAHTPWGLDALKKRLGNLTKQLGAGVPTDQAQANRIAETMRDTVEQHIAAHDPGYTAAMQAYAEPSNLIRQIESSLSLNNKAALDTTLRKLQSVMRNNVSTNWGYRRTLADELGAKEPTLIPSLAGQALSSREPRGAARMTGGWGSGALGMLAWLKGLSPVTALGVAGIDHLASMPRVSGEIAQKAGKVAGLLDAGVSKIPAPVRKVGRKAVSPEVRGAVQEAGGIGNTAAGLMTDAKGNVYDMVTGKMIQRGPQQ